MEFIRLATAGSVDDGKSTLIGRLLFETDSLFEDQVEALAASTARRGETGINLALVTDGLRAEREQNITIDVAYRPFRSGNRRFLLADSPGHVQYTRNMVTAASTADCVIVLADASRGLTPQSKRHLSVAALMRTPVVVIAVNKMDLVGFDQEKFESVFGELESLGKFLGCEKIIGIPLSALNGDNVVTRSANCPWYSGPSLIELLGNLEPRTEALNSYRLPVQNVLLYGQNRRAFAGSLLGGSLNRGDTVRTSSGQESTVTKLYVAGTESDSAPPGAPVAIELADEVDISRGTWLFSDNGAPLSGQRIRAKLVWFSEEPIRVGMTYRLQQGSRNLLAKVTNLSGQLEIETGQLIPTGSLSMNDIGEVELEFAQPHHFETYKNSRDLGSFILVSPHNQTLCSGLIDEIYTSETSSGQKAAKVLWLTGLSGAGKSTIAEAFIDQCRKLAIPVMHLDGDALRTGLCSDLGFSPEERMENIRRAAEVAKLFSEHGMVTICSLISPLIAHRDKAAEVVGEQFVRVYVKASVETCIGRDPKGLYQRALSGAITNFTGISAPFEIPTEPDLILDTENSTISACVDQLLEYIRKN